MSSTSSVPLIVFELWVHAAISWHKRKGRDLPVIRRLRRALIETSLPTVVLGLHINSMGPQEALGFVCAAGLFRLHYPLDTAARFLAVDLHRLVAAAELFYMAVFFHPASNDGAMHNLYYHASAQQ